MHYSDDPDLELGSMDEATSHPDPPLIVPTETQPKWWPRPPARIRSPRHLLLLLLLPWRQHHITTAWSAARTRPRKNWKYILAVAVALYAIVCLARGVPLLASPLPAYTGPYDVGAIDVEIPLETPRRVSDTVFKSSGEPAFELRTALFTVYYPVARGTRETKPRHPWIAHPVGLTAEGYARFAHVNNFVVRPILTFALWAIAGSISIPAKVDAPLLGPDDKTASSSSERFPVMVFSHGMASSRTDYTNYVGELASRGYIVAAIEHRDGSCPGSLMKLNNGQPDKKKKKIVHFREGDLLSDSPMDTPRLKQEQLAFRDAEILETIKILQAINAGQGARISALNTRSEGTSLAAWARRLDLDKLIIGGHSYGATGALQALRGAPSPSNPAIGGIILDPGKSSGPLNDDIAVPILVVHSNSWSRQHSIFFGRPHFDTVRDLVRRVLHRPGAASWFLTSLGTSHPSVSDAPLIEPLLLSFTTGASLNVKQALQEYVNVSVQFYELLRNGEIGGLLAEKVTHEEYGLWVSKEREDEFPKDKAKLWEIHVSPVR